MTLSEGRILVVDDEPMLCEIFVKWLNLSGCRRVRCAANGLEAIAEIDQEPIDLLLSDVYMPLMTGPELVRALGPRTDVAPIILFVSGFGDIDRKEMHALGVEAFLAKPLHRNELIRLMEHALSDRADLWHTPMETAPRQTLTLEDCVLDCSLPYSKHQPTGTPLCLGRGGFSTRYDKPLHLGKISFDCGLPADGHRLTGQGCARWLSRDDHSIGIEFTYLDPQSRSWLAPVLDKLRPRSFIPAL